MENETLKVCENCYYFYQHYYKSKHGQLVEAVGDGHCVNENVTKAVFRKYISKSRACEFWQPQEAQISERRESVCRIISKMQERLDNIALLLQND